MNISKETRQIVRSRANFACEYCSVSEIDAGSELTLDHFHPPSKGGDDSLENLVYCCQRCNGYKSDYFPATSRQPSIWNPRHSPASRHFIQLDDGYLKGLTKEGEFTIRLLRLNRPQLIAMRAKKKNEQEKQHLLSQLLEITAVLKQTNQQVNNLSHQQQSLLEEQFMILKILTRKDS